jgi:hypothetical protein
MRQPVVGYRTAMIRRTSRDPRGSASRRWFQRVTDFFVDDFRKMLASPPGLPEDRIPTDKNGKPDLSYYTQPLEHYVGMYNASFNVHSKESSRGQHDLAWRQRVHATWGLLAKGPEALPFLLTLIRHQNPDARETGVYLLGELRSDDTIGGRLRDCLKNEDDLVVKSAVIEALGKLRYRPAIPAIASIVLNTNLDIDTRWNATDSLARIVGQDFSGPDRLQKAERWLAAREETGST